PAGLTMSTAGKITGTPTAGGTFNFTVTATDSSTGTGPFSGSQSYSLVVAAPTIAISPTTLPGAKIGTSYNHTLTATGGTAPYTSFMVTAGTLPTGLTLSTSGLLSGVPTIGGGTFSFTVTATDSSTGTGPFTGSATYVVTITPKGYSFDTTNKILTI